jgi:hypothetical protein
MTYMETMRFEGRTAKMKLLPASMAQGIFADDAKS